ncbi:MAG: hypothetical protein IJH38_02620 [Clostridia bacterium]|nr:hypothetical protein [Clostridia bacterium]
MKRFDGIRRPTRPGGWLWRLWKLVPYAAMVLSGMLIVFFLIDRVNKPMAFMTNEFHKVITFILALTSITLAIRVAAVQREAERKNYRARLKRWREGQKNRAAK